jgi:hypothetical protein
MRNHDCTFSGVLMQQGILGVQSRNRLLTTDSDMLGFCQFVHERKSIFVAAETSIRSAFQLEPNCIVRLTGEWCGEGVQTRVAVSEFSQRFWVLFDISIYSSMSTLSETLDLSHAVVKAIESPHHAVYVITNFPCYDVVIDLADR